MENFFYETDFYSDLGELMEYLDLYEIEDVEKLPDDYEIQIEQTTLEKMFQLKHDFVVDAIVEQTDTWEERFPEEPDHCFEEIKEAISKSIDIEKMNKLLPSLYYPNGEKVKLNKNDLLDYIK